MNARDERLEELQQRLAQGLADMKSSDDWKLGLATAAKFHKYSYTNAMLILIQHKQAFEQGAVDTPLPGRVAGYRKWQELGRQVDKGQKAYQILAPVTARYASATPNDPGSFRKLRYKEVPNPNETVKHKMVGVKPANVFEISQTSGEPLPEMPAPKLLTGAAPEGAWDLLAAQVKDADYTIRMTGDSELGSTTNGLVNFLTNEVLVHADRDPAQQVKTLAHELGHIRLHSPEYLTGPAQPRAAWEMEAESFAFMVCDRLGMDTSDYTFGYVAGWSAQITSQLQAKARELGVELTEEQVDAANIKYVGERVRKAAAPILTVIDEATPEPPLSPVMAMQTQQALATQHEHHKVIPLPNPVAEMDMG